MEKINIAELLKDCPKGMELDCTMYKDVCFYKITDDPVFPIHIKRIDGAAIALTKYGGYADSPSAKCVIFPKGKTTWEGFVPPCKFKDGDIVTCKDGGLLVACIYKERKNTESFNHHIALYKGCLGILVNGEIALTDDKLSFATEEEKQKLFQAIKDNGYKWNAETKTLEKLPKFKCGDVVACDCSDGNSQLFIFKEYNDGDTVCYLFLDTDGTLDTDEFAWEIDRLATEREKELLFRAIEEKGYRWNEETKTLEKLIEPKFKVGDKIKPIGSDRYYIIKNIESTIFFSSNMKAT